MPDYAAPFAGACWVDVVARREALPDLAPTTLLHAGPPYDGPPPAPVLHAAMQAAAFEGLAPDATQARQLLLRGALRLEPAQDHGVATPLAQVVSASMPLVAVRLGSRTCHAAVIEGPPPALRFGSLAPDALQRLRALLDGLRGGCAARLRRTPIAIAPLVDAGIAAGDDCHARTGAAHAALVAALLPLDAGLADRLRDNPGFVLALLMAASAAALRGDGSDLDAIGGNGVSFGIRLRGEGAWRSVAAQPPRGIRLPGRESAQTLGAIGDSALVDACGLGGQALAASPALASEWRALLPADAVTRREQVIAPATGLVSARRVAQHGCGPLVNLAMLDAAGIHGLIGRGVYEVPAALFRTIDTAQAHQRGSAPQ